MKILLIGPQGSGKSTQGKLLADFLGLPYVSTGDIFRKMGGKIKQMLDSGQLVDDETTVSLLKSRIGSRDCQNGFIMDGYPRNLEQVKLFDSQFDRVIFLNVPEKVVVQRLLKRGRADDTPEGIKTRLQLYYRQTQPLLDYYQEKGKLMEVEAIGDIQKIQDEIKKFV